MGRDSRNNHVPFSLEQHFTPKHGELRPPKTHQQDATFATLLIFELREPARLQRKFCRFPPLETTAQIRNARQALPGNTPNLVSTRRVFASLKLLSAPNLQAHRLRLDGIV